MTSIHRTAYPHFRTHQKIAPKELSCYYSLTEEELSYVKNNIRGDENRLGFAVQLKVFQYLNYFPTFKLIPTDMINHLKSQISFIDEKTIFSYKHESALQRHRDMIYSYLNVTPWRKRKNNMDGKSSNPAQKHALEVAYAASQTMNHPADIINVVTESMVKNHYELPAFNQLSRLVKHVRDLINRKLFQGIEKQLSDEQKVMLDNLLVIKKDYNRTGFNALKNLPKSPTITHFRELIKHHHWLTSLINTKKYVEGISPVKLQQFAEQAKTLDAGDLDKYSIQKRYSLMIFLIHQAQCRSKDSLAITFCKTLARMHKKARDKLEELQKESKEKTNKIATILMNIVDDVTNKEHDLNLLGDIINRIHQSGGPEPLREDCSHVIACNNNQALHLLSSFYTNKRSTLFRLLDALELKSTTQNDQLIKAMNIIQENETHKTEFLSINIDLSFTTREWRRLIVKKEHGKTSVNQQNLELCVFSHLAEDLHSGDIYVDGANSFADYRESLLDMKTCQEQMSEYCGSVNLPHNSKDFINLIKNNFTLISRRVDQLYPAIHEFEIDKKGRPVLKKRGPKKRPSSAIWLADEIKRRLPERNIIDILCNSHHYTGWAHVFGPISGSDPKIKDHIERYILTNFAYGSAMGPTQLVQHLRTDIEISAHMLSWINRRHVTPTLLDKARELLINVSNTFPLLTAWGDGQSCAADGTLCELREENLIAEFHARYHRKGGIAYHHVSNNYIALFSTFIPCGVWEAVEIIEGLLKNKSDVQPKTIHADTQGQSTVVFALSYLLGFKLMPRIRNWKDYKFFKPDKKTKYKHIESLFSDPIRWDLIETHWQDMMQVILSIKAGKISSSLLLRKLGSYSRKNKLYYAFQELGRVIRTQFLLEYISDVELREIITETTNKVESYNRLSKWTLFGSTDLVASNDEDEMEKAIKYNDILTNSIILQNIIDITEILVQLMAEGYTIKKEDVAFLSPYLTGQIKRFGDYLVNLSAIPRDISVNRACVLW